MVILVLSGKIDIKEGISEPFFGLVLIEHGRVILQRRSVVYLMNIGDPHHILLEEFEDLFSKRLLTSSLLLDFVDKFVFQNETSIEQSLVVIH